MPGIGTTRSGPIGTLIIDNPTRRNAMTADMYAAVPDAVAEVTAHPDVRVVVLRGAGDEAFGAGSDISEFAILRVGDQAESYDSVEHAAWQALSNIPIPVIAAVHGPCMGGGIAMALHCDIRVAAEDATFAVPPARLGLAYPQGALVRLVELIGPATAKMLLYSARVFAAAEALTMGLVQEVVPKTELDARVEELATDISRLAPLTHKATKLSVDSIRDDAKTGQAVAARAVCHGSADFHEGVQAFLEKRRAIFEGR
jgi:enoyl-CoA hydratase/carnithine racemase